MESEADRQPFIPPPQPVNTVPPPQYPPQSQYPQPYQPVPMQSPPPANVIYVRLGRMPVFTKCPHCRAEGVTRVERAPGVRAWMYCLLLALVCWVLCWLPFCLTECQEAKHYCSACGQFLGQSS